VTAPAFANRVLGWKRSPQKDGKNNNKCGWGWVPNCADVDSTSSLVLAKAMLDNLGQTDPNGQSGHVPLSLPRDPGTALENEARDALAVDLPALDASRQWLVLRGQIITTFAQYQHLTALDAAIAKDPNLRVTVGKDYLIKPDVTVGIGGIHAVSGFPFLHAAVSCKWTIRSDRVQNIRHEFNQMIRHRRGRQPHLVTLTAEPLPSRLTSIARGTGEVDATYHVAFDELAAAVAGTGNAGQQDAWNEVVGQRRLRDFNDLAQDFVLW
jgi:hypothetical protein